MFIFLEIRAELLFYSEEYQQLNPNLGDWGMVYDNEHELIEGELPLAGPSAP